MNRYEARMKELKAHFIYSNSGILPFELSDDQLAALEGELGAQLPPDYREFLRDYGCYDVLANFSVEGHSQPDYLGMVNVFYGLTPPDTETLRTSPTIDLLYQYKAFKDISPSELIVIGDDGGFDCLCLALFGEQRGAIYHWDRTEEWEITPQNTIYKVADSFDEFLGKLAL